jgi:hypothetical protein
MLISLILPYVNMTTCQYHHMSLTICQYHHMSISPISPYVNITICRYHHMAICQYSKIETIKILPNMVVPFGGFFVQIIFLTHKHTHTRYLIYRFNFSVTHGQKVMLAPKQCIRAIFFRKFQF